MAKKKQELPVFVVMDMPNWKSKVLQAMLQLMRVPGNAWVIAVEGTGFTTDGDSYTDKRSGIKIKKDLLKSSAQ